MMEPTAWDEAQRAHERLDAVEARLSSPGRTAALLRALAVEEIARALSLREQADTPDTGPGMESPPQETPVGENATRAAYERRYEDLLKLSKSNEALRVKAERDRDRAIQREEIALTALADAREKRTLHRRTIRAQREQLAAGEPFANLHALKTARKLIRERDAARDDRQQALNKANDRALLLRDIHLRLTGSTANAAAPIRRDIEKLLGPA